MEQEKEKTIEQEIFENLDGGVASNNTFERLKKRAKYRKMLQDMTPKDIESVILMIPHQLSICASEITKYNFELKKEMRKLETVYAELYKDYKFGTTDKRYRFGTKGEIESQIFGDVRWKNIKRRVDQIESRIEYWTRAGEEAKQTGFAIKNFIELKKLLAGEF